MDTAMVVAVISVGVSLISAVAAAWSAAAATRANQRADNANAIARDAVSKADEANRIAMKANEISESALEHQKRHAPPAWGDVEAVSKSKRRIENTSGSDVIIAAIDAMPESASGLLFAENLPAQVSYGDWYQFSTAKTMGPSVESINIHWHYMASPDDPQTTLRNLP